MPAYFSLTFEMNKTKTAVREFCENLIPAGLVFERGCFGFENDSFDGIITWNQNKLDKNFQLGDTEQDSHDYKQMLFKDRDFSEVRLFILNEKKEDTFSFELIVPESDLLDYRKEGKTYLVKRYYERMERLKSIASKIWENTSVLAVQTGWEGSYVPPLAKMIAKGVQPQSEPFCIISASSLSKKEKNLSYEYIKRDGVLIEDGTKWDD